MDGPGVLEVAFIFVGRGVGLAAQNPGAGCIINIDAILNSIRAQGNVPQTLNRSFSRKLDIYYVLTGGQVLNMQPPVIVMREYNLFFNNVLVLSLIHI